MSYNAVQPNRGRLLSAMERKGFIANPPTTNLYCWYAADKITGKNDGDSLTAWNDLSGNGRNLSSASNPVYKTNIINGFPVVRFVSPNTMDIGATTTLANATYFTVISRTSNTASDQILIDGASAYAYLQYDQSWYAANGTSINLQLQAGIFKSRSVKYTGSNLFYYSDGKLETSVVSALSMVWRYIGPWGGDMAELLVYNAALSDDDRKQVENYLNNKYNLIG